MEGRLEIYHPRRKEAYSAELSKLQKWKTTSRNKELIRQWHNHLFATGSGNKRVAKVSGQLRKLVKLLGKDLDATKKTDLEGLVAQINTNTRWSDATKADYRRCIKQFYLWYEDEDARLRSEDRAQREEARRMYAYLKKHIRTSYKEKEYDYGAIITWEEVTQVIEGGTRNLKEKAFLAVLHATGLRAGEMLNLRIQDVQIKQNNAMVYVDGKTGRRGVPVVQGLVHLTNWLNAHPHKDVPSGLVWLSHSPNAMYEPLKHAGAQQLINRCFERVGLKHKKRNLHWFRHSRATIWAQQYPESILCKLMGWVPGSNQVRRYVHLSGQQAEEAVLRTHGVLQDDTVQATRMCGCGSVNDAGSRYCRTCGHALDAEVAIKEQEYLHQAFEVLPKILADPRLRALFEKKLQEL